MKTMPRLLIPLLFLACLLVATMAQQPAPVAAPPIVTVDGEDTVPLSLPNSTAEAVIVTYETLTGKRVIRDSSLAQTAPINILVSERIKKSEAIHLIEATLLLNGIALTPGPDGSLKALNVTGGGKNPRSEGVPVYASAASLPTGDQVVSYFMALRYVSAAEAAQVFQQHLAPHPPYGVIVPVPNAQAIVITETTSVIRQLIKLQKLIDVPPAKVVSEFVPLLRADAERVADVLTKMLEARRNNQTALGQPPAPSPDFGDDDAGPNERNIVAGTVQLIADARTNRILVVTRPINFKYIKGLIQQFDESANISAPFERPLKYVAAANVLPVLQKSLAETKEDAQGATGQPQNQNQNRNNQRTNNNSNGSNSVSVDNPADDTAPDSVIVGKTKLIADNRANSILVIGPPEAVARASEILDKLDSAPRQVYLATVIGELSLVNDSEFGVDLLKKWSSSSGNVATQIRNTGQTLIDPATLGAASAFPALAGLSVFGSVGSTLDYYVRALQTTNRFKVLSRPSVYTSNNRKAMIASGQEVPIPGTTQSTVNSGTTNNNVVSSTVDYKKVELKLAIIPLINAEKEVTLNISQTNNTLGTSSNIGGNSVPSVNTQEFTTSITVPNRQTVVLGGLIISNVRETINGIPWLSDIPLVGLLFKDTAKHNDRHEIIILIEPNVIETKEELAAASQQERDKTLVGAEASKVNTSEGAYIPTTEFPKTKKTKLKDVNDSSSKSSTTPTKSDTSSKP